MLGSRFSNILIPLELRLNSRGKHALLNGSAVIHAFRIRMEDPVSGKQNLLTHLEEHFTDIGEKND